MKTASSGDGDKSLASKLCSAINETSSEKLNGWIMEETAQLMSCNYQDYLELDGCYLFIEGKDDKHMKLINKMISIEPSLKISNAGPVAKMLYVDTAHIPTLHRIAEEAFDTVMLETPHRDSDKWMKQRERILNLTKVQSGGSKRFYKFNLL